MALVDYSFKNPSVLAANSSSQPLNLSKHSTEHVNVIDAEVGHSTRDVLVRQLGSYQSLPSPVFNTTSPPHLGTMSSNPSIDINFNKFEVLKKIRVDSKKNGMPASKNGVERGFSSLDLRLSKLNSHGDSSVASTSAEPSAVNLLAAPAAQIGALQSNASFKSLGLETESVLKMLQSDSSANSSSNEQLPNIVAKAVAHVLSNSQEGSQKITENMLNPMAQVAATTAFMVTNMISGQQQQLNQQMVRPGLGHPMPQMPVTQINPACPVHFYGSPFPLLYPTLPPPVGFSPNQLHPRFMPPGWVPPNVEIRPMTPTAAQAYGPGVHGSKQFVPMRPAFNPLMSDARISEIQQNLSEPQNRKVATPSTLKRKSEGDSNVLMKRKVAKKENPRIPRPETPLQTVVERVLASMVDKTVQSNFADKVLKLNLDEIEAEARGVEGIRSLARGQQLVLWQFLLHLLFNPDLHEDKIHWTTGGRDWEFKIVDVRGVATLWGEHKNCPKMNYEKMARGLRYYYPKMTLRKSGKRYVYHFSDETMRKALGDDYTDSNQLYRRLGAMPKPINSPTNSNRISKNMIIQNLEPTSADGISVPIAKKEETF